MYSYVKIYWLWMTMMCASSGFCTAYFSNVLIPCLVCNPLHFQELQNSGLMQPQVVSPAVPTHGSAETQNRKFIPALSALLSSLVSSMSTVEAYHDKSRCGTRWTNCWGWKNHVRSMDLVDKMRFLSTKRFHLEIKRGLVFHICSNDSMLVRHLLTSCSSQPFCHLCRLIHDSMSRSCLRAVQWKQTSHWNSWMQE